jgi:hypothetical protein
MDDRVAIRTNWPQVSDWIHTGSPSHYSKRRQMMDVDKVDHLGTILIYQ